MNARTELLAVTCLHIRYIHTRSEDQHSDLLCITQPLQTQVMRLTLRRLMSYIYGAPILDVSRSHTTTQHSR